MKSMNFQLIPSDCAECICLSLKSLKSTTATLMLVDNTLGLDGCREIFKEHAGISLTVCGHFVCCNRASKISSYWTKSSKC